MYMKCPGVCGTEQGLGVSVEPVSGKQHAPSLQGDLKVLTVACAEHCYLSQEMGQQS